MIASIGDILV